MIPCFRKSILLLAVACSLPFVGIAIAWTATKANDGDAKIVFPPEHSVLLQGTFHLIAKGIDGELKLDGQTQAWEGFQWPLRVAKIGLSPGIHEIEVGQRKVEFVVGLSPEEHDGPKDWPIVRGHQIRTDVKRCAACHQTLVQDGRTAVGELKGPAACFECHKQARIEQRHPNLIKPLNCQECHTLHGSSNKSFLKPGVK